MLLTLLFLIGLFAGTVDAIAGGGGLISLPILLGMGMPPHLAFGTNKLQGTIGTLVATHRYYRQGLISFEFVYKGVLFGIMGSILGAIAGQLLSSEILRQIIPVLLLIVLSYTIFTPKLGGDTAAPRMSEFWFYIVFGFGLGFYDGFFGPGTGSFWIFSLAFFLGYDLIKATAYTKVFNLNSSFIATICFAIGGNIDYRVALCMAAGQVIGGRLGAYLAIMKGARLIRPVFLTVVSATIAALMYRSYVGADNMSHNDHLYALIPTMMIAGIILFVMMLVHKKVFRQSTE